MTSSAWPLQDAKLVEAEKTANSVGLSLVTVFNLMPFGLLMDREGIIVAVGPSMGMVLDREHGGLVGKSIFDIFTIDCRNYIDSIAALVACNERKLRLENKGQSEFGFIGSCARVDAQEFNYLLDCTPNLESLVGNSCKLLGAEHFPAADVSLETRILAEMQQHIFKRSAKINRELESAKTQAEAIAEAQRNLNTTISQIFLDAGQTLVLPGSDETEGPVILGRDLDPQMQRLLDANIYTADAISQYFSDNQLDVDIGSLRYWRQGSLDHFSMDVNLPKDHITTIQGLQTATHTPALMIADTTEIRRQDRRIFHKQKMEALGVLTSGIIHDFNNLLAILSTGIELLLYDIGEMGIVRDDLDDMPELLKGTLDRASSLVRQLLAFSRHKSEKSSYTDLAKTLLPMRNMLVATLGSRNQLVTDLQTKAIVGCDSDMFQTAIINLVVNARDAMKKGGVVRLEINELSDEELIGHNLTPGRRFIAVRVLDTGVGIPIDLRERVFEPFFTTKPAGRGTGLGLSLAQSLVHQAGGAIEISDNQPCGTIITLYLPVISENIGELSHDKQLVTGSLIGRRLILVEDEFGLATAIARFGERIGMHVDNFSSCEDLFMALERNEITKPDLLLTDYLLPDGSGHAVAKAVRAHFPDVAVIIMSGNFQSHIDDHCYDAVLEKPFPFQMLKQTMIELIT